ncbi:MAG: MBL fold metallo-hydrolase [Chloroflexota bacterium]
MARMLVRTLVVGNLESNCHIIADGDSGEAMIVDPGDEPDRIMDAISERRLKTVDIVCTHGHFDHVGAVSEIKEETGARVVMHRDELAVYRAATDMAAFWGFKLAFTSSFKWPSGYSQEMQASWGQEEHPLPYPDLFVGEGDKVSLGDLSFTVLHTPGHSPGGICLYGEGIVITGDTLFAGSVGRTDFAGGSMEKLKLSFRRLMALPEETKVLCGHGPHSTIGHEKRHNMFAQEFLR